MRNRARFRLVLLFAALPVILAITGLAYRALMARLENQSRSFIESLAWAAETLTTTGYGADAHWDHPGMIAFVITTQFLGVFLVYMVVPLLLVPYLEDRFELRAPTRVPRLRGHVIAFHYGLAVEALVDELRDSGLHLVMVELDDDRARTLAARKREQPERFRHAYALHGVTVEQVMRAARLDEALALVTGGSDEDNTAAVLVARELGFEGKVLAVVEEPFHRHPLETAGATRALTPRHELGAALAARASHQIEPRVSGFGAIESSLSIAEIRVQKSSALAGQTLRQARLPTTTGAIVVGQWVQGQLDARPTPETVVAPRGLLVAVGSRESLDALSELATDGRSLRSSGPFVVAGFGEVGRKVTELLRQVGERVVVIDEDPTVEGVDIYGDITDPEVLDAASLDRARALVMALDSDASTLFATVMIRDRVTDLPLVARVNAPENIDRLYRAGADFAMSISRVSAQILAHSLLQRPGQEMSTELEVVRVGASRLLDEDLSVLDVRRRTGCSVLAVERDGEWLTGIDADFHFTAGDRIYACGHRDAAKAFRSAYGDEAAV